MNARKRAAKTLLLPRLRQRCAGAANHMLHCAAAAAAAAALRAASPRHVTIGAASSLARHADGRLQAFSSSSSSSGVGVGVGVSEIKLNSRERIMTVVFDDGVTRRFSAELLRVRAL